MKPRYKVNLAQQQALCDANYLRLCKLLPDLDSRDERVFAISGKAGSHRVAIRVLERTRYTTTVLVVHDEDDNAGMSHLTAPELSVRLYHDARMAEVIAWQRHRYMKARYEYPNRQMYQSDEKAQFNLFLGEWLNHCLEQGHVVEDIMAPLGLTG